MGTLPIYKKHFLQLILTKKKKLSFDKISPRDLFFSFLFNLYLYPTIMGKNAIPDSKVYGANMGPTWDRQGPGGSHVGPMSLAIWNVLNGSHS